MTIGILPCFNYVSLFLYAATLLGVAIVYCINPKALSSIPLYIERRLKTKDFFGKCEKKNKKCKTRTKTKDCCCETPCATTVSTCDEGCDEDDCSHKKKSKCKKDDDSDTDCSSGDESDKGSDSEKGTGTDSDSGGCTGKKNCGCDKCCRKIKKVKCNPPKNVARGQLFIWPIIFIVLVLCILYHLTIAMCTDKHSWYQKEVTLIGNNPVRWLGYALLAGLIMPVVGAIVGLRNQNSILLLVAAVIGEAVLHLMAERTLVTAKRPLYNPDWCMVSVAMVAGIAVFIFIWVVLIRTYFRNRNACSKDCSGTVPVWVSVVFWTEFTVGVLYWLVLITLAACPNAWYCHYECTFVVLGWIGVLVFVIATTVGLVCHTKKTKCWLPFLAKCERCCC